MIEAWRLIDRLAPLSVPVLLIGEPGTGKSLFARILHDRSPRWSRPLVRFDCTVQTDSPSRSAHEADGSAVSTGSLHAAFDRLETTGGGTLVLDHVDDLRDDLQAALAGLLQDRMDVARSGRAAGCDLRLVSTTRVDLRQPVSSGVFREDLLRRLAGAAVALPPLRERAEDAVLLAHLLVERLARENGRERLALGPDALDAVAAHRWPGNVRELEEAIARAVRVAPERTLTAAHLGLAAGATEPCLDLRRIRETAERAAVCAAMARCQGNILRAAELLGVSRPTLYDLLRRFGLR